MAHPKDRAHSRRKKKIEGLTERRELLDEGGVKKALGSIADEILRRHPDPSKLVLVGIYTGGVVLSERLKVMLAEKSGQMIALGTMDITLYRDDVFSGLPRPEVGPTKIPCALEGRVVILVDDVLFTGRTIRAALMELMDFGRPASVELAVLVDRGHRELPIHADYVGLKIETTRAESVRVMLREMGEPDRVALFGGGAP